MAHYRLPIFLPTKATVRGLPVLLCCALIACGMTSCIGKRDRSAAEAPAAAQEFRLPEVPLMLTDPAARAGYVVEHYWDGYDFAAGFMGGDTVHTEEIFGQYAWFTAQALEADSKPSIQAMLTAAQANEGFYKWLINKVNHYFYNPNSPMRNEEIYAAALEQITASPLLDEYRRLPYERDWRNVNKNRSGTVAADLDYVTIAGGRGNLRRIQSEYTLVWFNNPGCSDCERARDILQTSPEVTDLLRRGRLTILALYPDDDLAAWRNHRADIPREWINARTDKPIVGLDGPYDLRAIPSLYLLDRDKRVLLKDATVEQTIQQLGEALSR